MYMRTAVYEAIYRLSKHNAAVNSFGLLCFDIFHHLFIADVKYVLNNKN